MNMVTLLDVEIEELFNKLSNMDPDSKEYAAVNDNLAKLMDRRIEIEKLEVSEVQAEKQMKLTEAQNEKQLKLTEAQAEKQMKEERKARLAKNIIDVGAIVLPLAVTIWGASVSLQFEERGTITTAIGRKFIDKLIKK